MKIQLFLPFAAITLMFIISCKKTPNNSYYDSVTCNDPGDSLNTYSKRIGSILTTSCVRSGCHDSGTHKKGVNLEGYDNAVSSFNHKPILCAIHHDKGCKPMPDDSPKLSDEVIREITCWAKNGYLQ